MVGGMLTHLKSLRRLERGTGGKIHELLAEAENERKHLMFFMELVQPTFIERVIIVLAQLIFWHYYLILYLVSPKTAHLTTAYFEIEAVRSYTEYLELIKSGEIEDVPCPQIAIDYYEFHQGATLRDMVMNIRWDEARHSDSNFAFAAEY